MSRRRPRSAAEKRAEREERRRIEGPAAEVRAAGSIRELYQAALAQPGATVSSVARHYGVSRQAVSQATREYIAHRERARGIDARRRPATGRRKPYTCSVCGRQGCRADRHQSKETT